MALKRDGSVVAWGNNTYGECTVPSPNDGFTAVAAGAYHCLGLKSDGSVVAWGKLRGTISGSPLLVPGRHAINAALASSHPENFASHDSGHGTHTASIAAGDGSQPGNCHGANHYVGVAPDADLVIVKTSFQDQDIVDAIRFVFSKAAPAQGAVVTPWSGKKRQPRRGTRFSAGASASNSSPWPVPSTDPVARANPRGTSPR